LNVANLLDKTNLISVFTAPPIMMIRDVTRCVVNLAVRELAKRNIRTFTKYHVLQIIDECNIIYLDFFKHTQVKCKVRGLYSKDFVVTPLNHLENILHTYNKRIDTQLNWIGYYQTRRPHRNCPLRNSGFAHGYGYNRPQYWTVDDPREGVLTPNMFADMEGAPF